MSRNWQKFNFASTSQQALISLKCREAGHEISFREPRCVDDTWTSKVSLPLLLRVLQPACDALHNVESWRDASVAIIQKAFSTFWTEFSSVPCVNVFRELFNCHCWKWIMWIDICRFYLKFSVESLDVWIGFLRYFDAYLILTVQKLIECTTENFDIKALIVGAESFQIWIKSVMLSWRVNFDGLLQKVDWSGSIFFYI